MPTESWPLMWYNLAAGDCVNSPNLGLGTDSTGAWPDVVTQVQCTQRHVAEIYFSGNLWATSAKYPGDSAVSNTAQARCSAAFAAYVGIDISQSTLSYDYWTPTGGSNWDLGDRQVICVAYDPGVPLSASVKGTQE